MRAGSHQTLVIDVKVSIAAVENMRPGITLIVFDNDLVGLSSEDYTDLHLLSRDTLAEVRDEEIQRSQSSL